MKDEIKKILDRLERIDHKEYIAFEFADSATFDETARCFEERKKMADYITNLQSKIDKSLEYMENYIKVEDAPINDRIKIEFEEIINILTKGDE